MFELTQMCLPKMYGSSWSLITIASASQVDGDGFEPRAGTLDIALAVLVPKTPEQIPLALK